MIALWPSLVEAEKKKFGLENAISVFSSSLFLASSPPDYNEATRRRSEDFSPTEGQGKPAAAMDWELNKANSLRFRSSHHHPKASAHNHAHHVMKAEPSSISNQNIHHVDSIEILPIFHKLLEDKRSSDCAFNHYPDHNSSSRPPMNSEAAGGSSRKNRFHSARSCPDMSVRCDIVEYL